MESPLPRPAVGALLSVLLAGCGGEGAPIPPGPDPWVDTAIEDSPGRRAFAPCASCHLADASGRPDGTVPRLAGQDAEVLAARLRRIRGGGIQLPVMLPFARALQEEEIELLADWLAELPAPLTIGHGDGLALSEGSAIFDERCAACHGPQGMGGPDLGAPRLCGQHAGYLARRLSPEDVATRRAMGPAMAAMAASLSEAGRLAVADFLSRAPCTTEAPP